MQDKDQTGGSQTTPYLALTDELWGVFCEYLREKGLFIRRFYCSYVHIRG